MGSGRGARPAPGPDAGPRPTRRGRGGRRNLRRCQHRGGARPREDAQGPNAAPGLRGEPHPLSADPPTRAPPPETRSIQAGLTRFAMALHRSPEQNIPTGTNLRRRGGTDMNMEGSAATDRRDVATERRMKAWVLALTSVASFMVALDALVVATALGAIRRDFGTSIEMLQWTMNAYNLSFAVLLLTGAALGDRFGRRRMFVAGLSIFVVASAACALAGNAGSLIAARAVQGAGAALVMPLAMALLSAAFPPQERGKALGVFSGLTGLALIAGPVVGGAVAESIAWQWIFWINIPIGLIAIPLVRSRIPESFGPGTALDIPGVALVTGAALGLVWGLMRGNNAGWASPEVAAALVAGFLLAIAFVAWELRAGAPMLPMRLFRSRAFSSGNAASFLYSASLYGTVFFMAQFLQTALGHGPLGAGLRLLPWTATLFVVAPIAGALVNRIGERRSEEHTSELQSLRHLVCRL